MYIYICIYIYKTVDEVNVVKSWNLTREFLKAIFTAITKLSHQALSV